MDGWIVSFFFSFYISDVVSEEIGQKKLRQTVTVLRVIYHVMTLSTMACCLLVPKHNKMAQTINKFFAKYIISNENRRHYLMA